ncbi:MAG: TraY domain-containing protein [Clostridia bacterium]|nr:TraY domain-containing protein [Clostridia bacterium]
MKPLKKKVSITLDEDVVEKLKIVSEDCDRSLSQYINVVLKSHLKRLDEKNEKEKR